jgi:hypothetical protein
MPCTIFSFRIPLLCVVKVYKMDMAPLTSVHSIVPSCQMPMYKCTSCNLNGVSSLIVPVYPPPRPQQEEKCDSDHVVECLSIIMARNSICLNQYVNDDDTGDGFYSVGGQIFALVGPDLSLDPEVDVAVDVFPDIMGPHPCERLTDHTKCTLQCSSSDGVLAGAMRPSWYRCPKTCRMGTGSSQARRNGSIQLPRQKSPQRYQCLSWALER